MRDLNLITKETKNGEIIYGNYLEPIPFCLHNLNREKCKKFHQTIRHEDGVVCCPYGLSVYVAENGNIYFSMRVKGHYDKKRAPKDDENRYNPLLTEEKILSLINVDSLANENNGKGIEETQDSLKHEIKQLNAQIKEKCDVILADYNYEGTTSEGIENNFKVLSENVRTIFVTSSMLSLRYTLDDYENEPNGLIWGGTFPCNIYKKFDKIRKIFHNYEKKSVAIEIKGNSYLNITAYSSFEFIPLLLIENAIKYSIDNNKVEIIFEEHNKNSVDCRLNVSINSYGPYCSPNEIERVFEKNYRGENARQVKSGSGIGLYFVKVLCDLHNIILKINSDESKATSISGVPYAPFSIMLEFNDVFEDNNRR